MFSVFLPGGERMGRATRTTKLPLDLSPRSQGGANTDKRAFLDATVQVLNAARAFYQHRYRHLKRLAKKQWLSGKPIKGEHSNQQLWQHVRRMNEDAAHQVARIIANICAKYPGCVLLFERLRKIKATGASKSRRINRRQANQLRGRITRHAKDKAFAQGVVTVEVNPHGTSHYCSRCGAKGERFSILRGQRITAKWGKLFWCPVCHYEANADLNASKNVHCSFYRQWHWQPREKAPKAAPSG
jgi:IS605 OrfB family transposase